MPPSLKGRRTAQFEMYTLALVHLLGELQDSVPDFVGCSVSILVMWRSWVDSRVGERSVVL